MSHDHAHHHPVASADMHRVFIIGIVLNLLFVIVEVVAGFYNHSMALFADAGHNLMDVGSLGLSLFAFRLLKVKSNAHYTYGYRKTSIIVALFNSVVLLVSVGIISYESIKRIFEPHPIAGLNISIVAGIGIIINFVSAILFMKNKEHDMNVKSAYLHLMSDALVSLGIVVGGIVIYYMNWFWLDPVLSLLVAAIILISTWKLLKDSLRLSLDGVPENINVDEVRAMAINIDGIKDLHHIHIWAISTTENALTAHLVLKQSTTKDKENIIKKELRHQLLHKNIHHITLETEMENEDCVDHSN